MNASATSDNALLYYCYNCMKAEIITIIVLQLVTDTECNHFCLHGILVKKLSVKVGNTASMKSHNFSHE